MDVTVDSRKSIITNSTVTIVTKVSKLSFCDNIVRPRQLYIYISFFNPFTLIFIAKEVNLSNHSISQSYFVLKTGSYVKIVTKIQFDYIEIIR